MLPKLVIGIPRRSGCLDLSGKRRREGKEKTIRQGHIKSNGLIQWQKGSKDWRAYKLTEAIKHCQGQMGIRSRGRRMCRDSQRA